MHVSWNTAANITQLVDTANRVLTDINMIQQETKIFRVAAILI